MPKGESYETQERIGHLGGPSGNDTDRTGRTIPKETQPRVGHLTDPGEIPQPRRTDKVRDAGENGERVPTETQPRVGHMSGKGGR